VIGEGPIVKAVAHVWCVGRLGTMLFFERGCNEGGIVATETE
jgi:hypothetical protein